MSAPSGVVTSISTPQTHSHSGDDSFVQRHEFWTHQIFPARTKLKDLAYWLTEIFAAVYLFILILGMGLTESPEITMDGGDKFTVMTLTDPNNNLALCEFGWIALAYSLKYLVYIVDTVMMLRENHCTGVDLVPVSLNFIVWVIWTLYGFLSAGAEISSGMSYRYAKDMALYQLDKGAITQAQYDSGMQTALDTYNNNQTGTWIWIPCIIAAVANCACWVMGMLQKRSTLFTNAAISTWFIPLQLFCFNLALKGSWFKSSYKINADDRASWNNKLPPSASAYRSQGELFDARYIFIIIYFASWICLAFAVANVMRALREFKKDQTLDGVKYILYAIFFVSNFFWCLFMDAIYLEQFIAFKGWLIIFSIISIVMALGIAFISLRQKFSQDPAELRRLHGLNSSIKPQ